MSLRSFDTQDHLLDVMEVYDVFSDHFKDEFTGEELLSASDVLVKVSKGTVAKEKVKEFHGRPTQHSRDTYTVMSESPWTALSSMHHEKYCEESCADFSYFKNPSYQQIMRGN